MSNHDLAPYLADWKAIQHAPVTRAQIADARANGLADDFLGIIAERRRRAARRKRRR
jgi:hypothetical protein